MSIYIEFITRVDEGEKFVVDFEKRNMKVGKNFLIKDGKYDAARKLYCGNFSNLRAVLSCAESLYEEYKYSLPSERSDSKRRKYFKALSINEMTDEQLMVADKRETRQAILEGFLLCAMITGELTWDDKIMGGQWFYQSKKDPDFVILRSWVENK